MPPKRTAFKTRKSYVRDSSVTVKNGRTRKSRAAGCDPVPAGAFTDNSIGKTTRTRRRAVNRSASENMGPTTATRVSLVNSSETVVKPWDRESQGSPTGRSDNNGVIQCAESIVGNLSGQGSGSSRVFVGVGGGDAVPSMRPALSSADCPASSTLADYPATTAHVAVSQLPITVMQRPSLLSPRRLRDLPPSEVRDFFLGVNAQTTDKLPITGENARYERNHRRSLSADGYETNTRQQGSITTRE